jgi:hypothetical protein
MDESTSQNDEMREIIDDFIAESTELIEKVVQDIVEIEKNPDDEIINGIFSGLMPYQTFPIKRKMYSEGSEKKRWSLMELLRIPFSSL